MTAALEANTAGRLVVSSSRVRCADGVRCELRFSATGLHFEGAPGMRFTAGPHSGALTTTMRMDVPIDVATMLEGVDLAGVCGPADDAWLATVL